MQFSPHVIKSCNFDHLRKKKWILRLLIFAPLLKVWFWPNQHICGSWLSWVRCHMCIYSFKK